MVGVEVMFWVCEAGGVVFAPPMLSEIVGGGEGVSVGSRRGCGEEL